MATDEVNLMRLNEITEPTKVSPRKERALKHSISAITREFPRAFKAKHYRITTKWVNEFKAHLEVHVDNLALQRDKKSYDFLISDVEGILRHNDNIAKYTYLGGADPMGPEPLFHYAVWELTFPYNL
jgi:hypothetical protein